MFDSKSYYTEDTESTVYDDGCCSRFRFELCRSPFFALEEPDGAVIDVERSFAPRPIWWTALLRLAFVGVSLSTLIYDLIEEWPKENRFIYFGYLTHWVFGISILYQLLAFFISICRCSLNQPLEGHEPPFTIRFLWALYAMMAPANLIVIMLYWILDFDPDTHTVTWLNVFKHGINGGLVWFDGLILGMIPLRMKQMLFIFLFALVYLIWNLIHDLATDLGDGDWEDEDPAENPEDDALYSALAWSDDAGSATVVAVLTLFVGTPVSFLIFWGLSLYKPCCSWTGTRRRLYTMGQERYRGSSAGESSYNSNSTNGRSGLSAVVVN